MATNQTETRVSLTKGEFVKIYRWQQQISLQRLAEMTGISIVDLHILEEDRANGGKTPNIDRLADLMGCSGEMWERVGVDPGFPGTEALEASKTAAKTPNSFATQINRIAAMPENWRHRQMRVIQRELVYLDA